MSKSAFTDAHKLLVETLIAARQASGLKQSDLSARLGKDQSFVSNIERGQRRVDVIEFCMLADELGIKPRELFDRFLESLPDSYRAWQ